MAAEAPPRYEITPMIGFASGGSIDAEDDSTSLDVDDGSVAGLAFHVSSPAGGQFEFSYWRDDTALETPGLFNGKSEFDVTVEYFQIGGTYPSDWRDGVHPYILATIGASRFDPEEHGFDTETFFAATAGGGVRFNISESLAIKVEGRAFMNFFDSDTDIFCISDADGGRCAIQSSGDLVTRWTALAGLAYRF